MASITYTQVFDQEDAKLTRREFRKLGREIQRHLTGLGYTWSYNLSNNLGEIVKNFYDHAAGQGSITVTIKGNEAWWEASNQDGGDSAGRTIEELIAHVAKHGSSRPDTKHLPDGNVGAGLMMMKAGFDGLEKCPDTVSSTWELDSKDRYTWRGHIVFKPKDAPGD